MSVKLERIESNILKELSYILAEEIKDDDIKFVTITAVELAADLGYAKVYVTVLDDTKKETTVSALNRAKGFIRKELAERVEIRHIPELNFVYDESIEYGKKIENIIDNLNVNDEKNI